MKIVILDGAALNPGDLSWEALAQFGEYTVYPRTDTVQEAIRRIGTSEIVLINKTPITREILDACPSVRYIGVLATGYNVVDCQAAREKGIPVTNVPSYGTDAVAQFTMALLLEICHRIGLHDAAVHQGQWERSPVFSFWLTPQSELAGKTMGIIGLGRIGTAVARLAQAFGMRVIAHSRTEKEGFDCVDLDTLLARSDVVSLHCPLFPQTQRLIRRQTLEKMKDGAILLNTSRGGLLDEADVAEALHSGKLRAAALDVVSQEPILSTNPLLHAPNCIMTPHMAWAPTESRQRLMDCVAENLRCFLAGEPQNVVNP
ncbi:MAG: D-2-hydroxyacid dehydrogenase [Faecousia sp.]